MHKFSNTFFKKWSSRNTKVTWLYIYWRVQNWKHTRTFTVVFWPIKLLHTANILESPQLWNLYIYFSCIHGNGQSVRNFLYCSDVAAAFDLILHKGSPGEIYNIGSNNGISVIDLAKYLIDKVSEIKGPHWQEKWNHITSQSTSNDKVSEIKSTSLTKEVKSFYLTKFLNWQSK